MKFSEVKKIDPSFELVSGGTEFDITGISPVDYPRSATIIFVKTKKFLNKFNEEKFKKITDIYFVFESKTLSSLEVPKELSAKYTIATVDSIDNSMCLLSEQFYKQKFDHLNFQVDGRQMGTCEIDATAEISQNVFIGQNVKIGKNVKICAGVVLQGEISIGDNSIIYPNVTIYPYTVLGENCRVHSGTILGGDGFGYNFIDGKHKKVWQFGGLKIGNDVEIGSSTTIDCGAFTETEIGDRTKIDNQCLIAHNVKIGKDCMICGMSGMAGSVRLDDFVAFGAGVGVGPSAHIGKGSQLGSRTMVMENSVWEAGSKLAGYPARPLREWLKTQVKLKGL